MRNDTPGGGEAPRTVVGVDGSEHARTAALWGAADALRHQQGLCLVHAADLDRLDRFASFETSQHILQHGRELLQELAGQIEHRFPGLDVALALRRERPVHALHTVARPGDTVVVGSRGSGGFGPLLLGSVGLGAAAGSNLPVVVVRGRTTREDGMPVVAAVADERDAQWVAQAAREARARAGALQLLHVRSTLTRSGIRHAPPEEAGRFEGPGQQLLAGLAARLREEGAGLTVSTEVITARSVAAGLVEASRGTDLLIVGNHKRLTVPRLGLGHVVHALLHHAHCPVQIMPCTGKETTTTGNPPGNEH
ncbi:universal stress protein UspA [Streptomyces sp. WZ.A104]|uniref:universal stress protein n=1 Tax=Streptomyces sp. WZ.A104 TaxID=2023771 RepID=UPI000BBCA660|nr:universal stress protein [Streptomyces sp. WZ.A104]PCG86976.1 universal stress protein UspA [Streptomyces sp. WZ.A104]